MWTDQGTAFDILKAAPGWLMAMTNNPKSASPALADIREAGRNTQGVKLIELESADKLKAIAPVISEEKEDATEPAPA
jgi:DNA gyrase subunit A